MKPASSSGYYLDAAGQVSGPYSPAQLRRLWQAGGATMADRICREGSDEWVSIRMHQDYLDAPPSDREVAALMRHGLYVLLAIAGGIWGAHNLFAKETGAMLAKVTGFVFLAAVALGYDSVVACWGLAGIWVWSLIEAAVGPDRQD